MLCLIPIFSDCHNLRKEFRQTLWHLLQNDHVKKTLSNPLDLQGVFSVILRTEAVLKICDVSGLQRADFFALAKSLVDCVVLNLATDLTWFGLVWFGVVWCGL